MKMYLCVALLGWPLLAGAQDAQTRSVYASGAGASASATYALTDTIGQPGVGMASSTTYAIANGFWPDHGDAPTSGIMNLGAVAGQTATLQLVKLLTRANDPNGDALRVVAVNTASSNGSVLILDANSIYYIPAAGLTGEDAFSYLIADTGGDTAAGTVSVNVVPGDAAGGSGISYNGLAVETAGSNARLSFLAIPGRNYALDRTFSLTPPVDWEPQFTNAVSANGLLVFTNTPVAGTNNFWRTRYVP